MKLNDYLIRYSINRSAFCRRAGIALSSLNNYLIGRIPSLPAAIKIVKATHGIVTYEDLANSQETAK